MIEVEEKVVFKIVREEIDFFVVLVVLLLLLLILVLSALKKIFL